MTDIDGLTKITVLAEDGVRFRYLSMRGDELTAPEVGWVLIGDGTHTVPPQAVSAQEVADDLATMSLGDDLAWMLEILRAGTEEMLEALLTRTSINTVTDPAIDKRISELRAELASIPPRHD